MARIRSVKPEYWTDPDVVELPMAARLFFIGTWNHADDYGVLKDEPARLKMQILPADAVDPYELVEELVQSNLLLRKVAPDGTNVLVIRTFCVHQKIDKRAEGRWGNPEEFTDPQPLPPNPHQSPRVPTDSTPGRELVLGGELVLEGTSSSASATRRAEFDEWWDQYPRKRDKLAAEKAYKAARKRATAEELLYGVTRDADAWARHGYETQHIPYPATWLNAGAWLGDPPEPRAHGDTRGARNDRVLDNFLRTVEGGAA